MDGKSTMSFGMNASSEGSTIADSKGGLKNGRSISKVSEKKNCP